MHHFGCCRVIAVKKQGPIYDLDVKIVSACVRGWTRYQKDWKMRICSFMYLQWKKNLS